MSCAYSSVVVGDFDVRSSLVCPAKAHAPLVVDPDAVLACPISTQSFEPMRRRNSKVG